MVSTLCQLNSMLRCGPNVILSPVCLPFNHHVIKSMAYCHAAARSVTSGNGRPAAWLWRCAYQYQYQYRLGG
jgi:hypothetical protein